MKLGLYRFMTKAVSPLIDLYLHRRLKAGKEDPARFDERLGRPSLPRPDGPLVWLHGASVGESLSALPLIHAIHSSWPAVSILVTTGTVTSAKLMAERLPKGAFHQYIPVDRISGIQPFLDHWRPDLALWMESEFWPNLLLETSKRDVPMILINGRVSDRSFNRWQKNKSMITTLLDCFTLCLGQTETDAERLSLLGAKSVDCFGNLKAAADPLPYDGQAYQSLKDGLGDRPCWLAASIHPGEDTICLDVHTALRQGHPKAVALIVPRHPERGPAIKRLFLEESDFTVALRSAGDGITAETDVYIADTIGELGLFYRLAPMTFIGKSLGATGGQNPLEAARIGTAILFGPKMDNFRDMADAMISKGAATEITSTDELAQQINTFMSNPTALQEKSAAAEAYAEQEAAVLGRITAGLEPHLAKRLGEPS